MNAQKLTIHNDSNKHFNRRISVLNEPETFQSIEIQPSIYCSRCQCHNRTKNRVRKMWTSLPSAILAIGLLLMQQTAQVTAMTLQHGVPGAGGRNAGDPAPGRSPGPPVMLDPHRKFQKLTIPSDSSQTMVRHRPEIRVDKRDAKLNDDIPERSEITRSYSRHQESTVGVSSSNSYREYVTQEYTKPTLGDVDYSATVSRFNGNARITSSGDFSGEPDIAYTMPVSRETNMDLNELAEADDFTRSWHQGGVLDSVDDDQDHAVSEENPTIILTSNSEQSMSLPSLADFSSYDEEEASNGTDFWCGGNLRAEAKVVTNQRAGLINVTVMHPLFRTDFGLVRGVIYQGKRRPGRP